MRAKRHIFSENADNLRDAFEDMIEEVSTLRAAVAGLKGDLANADRANIELYNEANTLEAFLESLREEHNRLTRRYNHLDQQYFDLTEDHAELEADFNVFNAVSDS